MSAGGSLRTQCRGELLTLPDGGWPGVLRAVLLVLCLLQLGACATPRRDAAHREMPLPERNSPTRVEQLAAAALAANPGPNVFSLLPDGDDALLARLRLIHGAERSLDLQYYIWRDDPSGRFMVQALLDAANRGVRVRVLLDDVGSAANDRQLLTLDAHPGVEIRLFNPVATRGFRAYGMLRDFSRTNRRMHNKLFLADQSMAILGGRNIGDEYFNASQEVSFGDLDVLTAGPVLAEVQASFQRYWDASATIPIRDLLDDVAGRDELDALRAELAGFVAGQPDSPYVRADEASLGQWLHDEAELFSGSARVLQDDPDKIRRPSGDVTGSLITQFGEMLIDPGRELLLVSPYFVPGPAGLEWFRNMAARGVRVTVLTNSLAASDVAAVHSGYARYREDLLQAGVRLYEMRPEPEPAGEHRRMSFGSSRASLHAKTFIFDRRQVFIGSLNLDPRSVKLNTEIGLLCESPAMAESLARGLEAELDAVAWRLEYVKDASGAAHIVWVEKTATGEQRYTREPKAGAMRRFGVWLLGLLPIESLL